MKSCKRILCLCLMLVMLAGLALPGHALGHQLSGKVTSAGEGEVTLELLREGNPVCSQSVTGKTAEYSLSGVIAGQYTLSVSKEGHVTREYQVTIGASDSTLDVKICLRGDVTGDGRINVGDVSVTYAHCKRTLLINDSYILACADYNSDGRVNVGDTSTIYATIKGGYKPGVKSVTLSVWSGSNDQQDNNGWLNQMELAFQKDHPEYRITWENSICHEGDAAGFVTSDPEGAADVYLFANDQIGVLRNAGAIRELTGKYREQVLEDNSQTMVNTVTYTDGGIYGFPMANNTWFMYYNKDIYTEEDVKSLDRMLEIGSVAFPWGVGWYGGTFFLANGGIMFGDQGNDASAGIRFGADDGGYEAALKMVQLAANPNFKEDVDGLGSAGLKNETIGAFFSGSWEYYGLYNALGDKLGAVQLPMVEIGGEMKQMKSFAGSKAVAVNPHAEEPELAMEFAAYLASPESQKLRYEYNGTIPAATELAEDPVIRNDPVALAEINTMANTAVVQPFIPEMNNYWTPMGAFGGMIANGGVNEDNYQEMVEWLMETLNSSGLDTPITPEQGATPEGNVPDGTPLKVWAPYEDQYDGDCWLIQMEEAFIKAHPEYQINWINEVCNEGDAGTLAAANPMEAGDVYLFANDQLYALKNAGAITQLTGSYLEQVLDDNSQTLIDTVTDRNGDVYGFPVANNTWFMYYNKDVFSEEDVKSLDTMLTKGTVALMWGVGWYSGTFFLANGGTIFGEKGNDALAGIQFGGDNGGYEAALKMVQLAANPNFKDDYDGLGISGLKTGEIGACFSGSWDYAGLKEALGDKLGAVQLPTVKIGGAQKQMKSFAGSKAVAVNPYSESVALATEFAAFLATPESQKLRYQLRGVIPAARELAEDAEIQQNPAAVAEINTMSNTSVVQPMIPEMSYYWTPMGTFGGLVSNGEVTAFNYQEQVDQMMAAFQNYEFPEYEETFRVNDIDHNSGTGSVTLRIHYNRPDGDYEGWNVWLWDPSVLDMSGLEPPYQFENVDGEMICTVNLNMCLDNIGYIIRYGDWEGKDVEYDQFLYIEGVISGTVDVYIQSGVPGCEIVYGDDGCYDAVPQSISYSKTQNRLVIKMSSPPDEVEATLTGIAGDIPITEIKRVNNYYYLTPETSLTPGSYVLNFYHYTIYFDIL